MEGDRMKSSIISRYSAQIKTTVAIATVSGLLLTFLLPSCSWVVDQLGGASSHDPTQMESSMSVQAKELIEDFFADSDGKPLVDHHAHIIGLGTDCGDCFVHPSHHNFLSPSQRFKFKIYASASGINNPVYADQEYISRLLSQVRAVGRPVKLAIFAFDKHYDQNGKEDLDKTEFYVPNSYVYELSLRHPDIFIPVISIHPYRRDAVAALEGWASKGVRLVKWLPNAMGIDPSQPRIHEFYRKMAEYGMILISHAGEEQAVKAEELQALGNPLLLRTALSHSVRVIVAHCASLGTCIDLDDPGKIKMSCFDLFIRMMDDPKYEGLLYGDISAMLQFNRMPGPLSKLLNRPDLHDRLVHGTDYPLVAINSLIRTRSLAKEGFITQQERLLLNEIYDYNPWLFDYILKRTVRYPGTEKRLSPGLFFNDLLSHKNETREVQP